MNQNADIKEIKAMLQVILDHLGITKEPHITRKQIEDRADIAVLKFQNKRNRRGNGCEGSGQR